VGYKACTLIAWACLNTLSKTTKTSSPFRRTRAGDEETSSLLLWRSAGGMR